MIFENNTIPNYRKRAVPVWCWNGSLQTPRHRGRKGLVLTCKDKLVHYYAKFGFKDYGRSESVHGGAVWW